MGLAQTKERRLEARRRTMGFLPGQMILAETGEQIVCQAIDVSSWGMGIFSEEDLDEGTQLILKLADQQISLEIVWTLENPGKAIGYRYGLKVRSPSVDLEAIFVSLGCL